MKDRRVSGVLTLTCLANGRVYRWIRDVTFLLKATEFVKVALAFPVKRVKVFQNKFFLDRPESLSMPANIYRLIIRNRLPGKVKDIKILLDGKRVEKEISLTRKIIKRK